MEKGPDSNADYDASGRPGRRVAESAIAYSPTVSEEDIGQVFERLAEENAVLAIIGRVMTASTDMDEVYEMMAAQLRRLVPFDRLVISTLDGPGQIAETVYATGIRVRGHDGGASVPTVGAPTERVMEQMYGSTIEVATVEQAERDAPRLVEHVRSGLRSFLSVPLVVKGKMVGALHLQSRSSAVYGESHLLLIERMASQLAGFIKINGLLRRLRDSEERYRDLFNNSPVGYVELDETGRITRVNRTQLEMYGYEEPEMVGRPMWSFSADPAGDQLAIMSLMRSRSSGGEGFECVAVRKDGATFHSHTSGLIVRDRDGRPTGMRVAMRDVTRLKQLEGQLARSQRMDALGKFAGGIAHDFSNMLTSIVLHVDHALSTASTDSESTETSLRQIQWAADRASDLTHKLLSFSRRQPTSPTVVDVHRLIIDTDELFKSLAGDRIELDIQLAEYEPLVRADVSGLEQVIINLVVNARDAMPDGGKLSVSTSEEVLDGGQEWVNISVEDTGIGMDEATKGRIFEPFFTTKHAGEGTGLGLSTSYGVINHFGGSIDVESAPGMGSIFTIRLPQVVDALPAARQRDRVAMPAPRGRATILLVEDNVSVREMMCMTLSELGYTVMEAPDGAEALRLLERGGDVTPDLVLTDIAMPQMNGDELAHRVREISPEMPILFTSGYGPDQLTDGWPTDLGVNYLQKPFSHERLAFKVASALEVAQRKAG